MKKMMQQAVWIGMLVAMLPAGAVAQTVPTTDAIRQAIAEGSKEKGSLQGLLIEETSKKWGRAFDQMAANANGGSANSSATTMGFRVVIYTPLTWIRQMASDAAKEYRAFTIEDLREEDTAPVLRMVVYPDTPTEVSAKGTRNTSSVQHVVLRDKDKKIVIQPSSKEAFNEKVSNAMGGAAEFDGLRLAFPLDGLRELRGANGDQEFVVTVVGAGQREKNFEVKKKHFDRLQ